MARFSSAVPDDGVYFVKFSSMARRPAALTGSGVAKSGSPAPKSITSTPARRSRSTVAVTAIVGELAIRAVRSASRRAIMSSPACAASLSRRRASTMSGTRPLTRPPSAKTSLMSRELM